MFKSRRMRLMQLRRKDLQFRSELMNQRKLIGRFKSRQGFGLNEVIGIAAGIIIAVVVVIPGLRGFAGNILNNLEVWWNGMANSIFVAP